MLVGAHDDKKMVLGSSMYLDDNGAYPKRLRTSLSKIMDKQLDYNNMANVIPIGPRSRSRSNSIGGDANPPNISAMLRSNSPIRISPVPSTGKVQPPKMFNKEYLLKNNNSNQVIKNVPLVGAQRNINDNKPHSLNSVPSGKPVFGHRRGPSSTSQISGTTKYVEFDPPKHDPSKFGERFPSSDSYTSSSPTVTQDLEIPPLDDANASNGLNNSKRNSILSNFMNDEQLWLNDKEDFQFPEELQFDKEKIDLTIKNLELKIDELKLDNDKLRVDNQNLRTVNSSLIRANESLTFQSSSLLKHIQQLPKISNTDFIVHNPNKTRENISDSLQLKSDELVKLAVEGKIKELEKELVKYRQIQKAADSRLSPRKNRLKYLTMEQLDALVESKNESEPEEETLDIANGSDTITQIDSTQLEMHDNDVSLDHSSPARLHHGFNLHIKLASTKESD